jgi:hypothetical protein
LLLSPLALVGAFAGQGLFCRDSISDRVSIPRRAISCALRAALEVGMGKPARPTRPVVSEP